MTYTHLTTEELVMIEAYYHQKLPVTRIAERLSRSRQPIYNVINFLKLGHTALDFYTQYKKNKKRCGRQTIVLPEKQRAYIQEKVAQGWTPDVIVGRAETVLDCSIRTLYRMFKNRVFDVATLPGKAGVPTAYFRKGSRLSFFPKEFGHIEGDTIVGAHHKSAVITLVERLTKVIIALKPAGRKACDIETALNQWFQGVPRNLFKSITFDCGKEFFNWKPLCNRHDVSIYFADPGTPSQCALNENSNGLLRKDDLAKEMDFNQVDQPFISTVADKRNNILRKSLDYRTPLEVFLSHLNEKDLSSLY